MKPYVERREGGYYVAGTRISLDSVVLPFKDGASPESILQSLPLIGSLEKLPDSLAEKLRQARAETPGR